MSSESQEKVPRHPIQIVARRTGLSADVIRVWERRYGAVAPTRSDANRRLYCDREVRRLELLRAAVRAGRRIGDVASLSSTELAELVSADAPVGLEQAAASIPRTSPTLPTREHLEQALAALGLMDSVRLEESLNRAARELAIDVLADDLLMPFLAEVGRRWHRKDVGIAHEHLASGVVRSLLDTLRHIRTHPFPGPEIVVATPAGQLHELGALTTAAIAGVDHWSVTYLGPDVPCDDIVRTVQIRRPRVLALSLVFPEECPDLRSALERLAGRLPHDLTVLVGGAAADSYRESFFRDGRFRVLPGFRELRQALGTIREIEATGGASGP